MHSNSSKKAKKATNRLPKSKKMLHSLTPKLTNATIRGAVTDYLAGGARKQRVVTQYGDISNWNVSKVTDMESMFSGARSFNQPLNNWDVRTRMCDYVPIRLRLCDMFSGATSFNQPLHAPWYS